MRYFWVVPVVFVALLIPVAVLAGSGFDGVVSSIESRYHVRATRIPFMGLVSMVARRATHEGVGDVHVAEIENFSAPVDGDELNRMVEEKLGTGWERMIRETSRKGKEQTLIFVHPEGERMGMFVVDLDGNEMDVVQVSVDPNHLNDQIGSYEHRHSNNDGNDAN
ncbi:MAG: hypothetical protein WAK26_20075 [Terracidiphilus sp.]